MNVIGIIAEYNPFHNGHAYQIAEIRRRTGADYIIVAMSGDFVQRGAPAVADKYARAKMALMCGADLVLELPTLWATASAESFAAAGVALFEKAGCVDGICFGAEYDNLPLLSHIAGLLVEEPPAYRAALASCLKEGLTFPQARAQALAAVLTASDLAEVLTSPNNILAIEYLKAIRRQNSSLTPYLIRREGAGYHDTEIYDGNRVPGGNADRASGSAHTAERAASPAFVPAPAASATAIRAALASSNHAICSLFSEDTADGHFHEDAGLSAKLAAAMPAPALAVLTDYLAKTPALWSDDFSPALGYLLLSATPEELAAYGDCNRDIANRLYKNRFSYRSLSQFCELNKSRDITYTRMSRILFHLLLGIRDKDYDIGKTQGYIPYLRILGFRRASSPLLSELKRRAAVPVISKLADAGALLSRNTGGRHSDGQHSDGRHEPYTGVLQKSYAAALLDLDIFAADLYEQTAAQKKGTTPRSEFTREIVRI